MSSKKPNSALRGSRGTAMGSADSLDSIMVDLTASDLLPITFNFQPQYATQQRDGKLMSLEYSLLEGHNRAKTYYQYTRVRHGLYMKAMSSIWFILQELTNYYQQHKDKLAEANISSLSNSLKWFALNFTRYGLTHDNDVYLRMFVLSSLMRYIQVYNK